MERSDFLGAVYIADTTTISGKFGAIQALEATVLASGTVSSDITGTLTSLPIPVGTTIYGIFTAVKLTSGKVLAYKL
jgi:hypothetical protein